MLIILASASTFMWLTNSNPVRDSVILKSYNSIPDAVQGILRKEVDLLPLDEVDLQTLSPLMNSTQVNLVRIPSFDFTYIGFNLRNWPLSDDNLRKAMLYAFDRPKALYQVLGGLGESLQPSLFSSAYVSLGWPTSVDPYGYDPAKAKAILDTEGFIESSTFRIDPSTLGTMRSMLIISRLSQPAEVAAADLFAKNMRTIGLPIVSFPMSDRDFDQSMRIYSFDLFIDTQSANASPTWLYDLFASKNDIAPIPLGTNLVGYKNPKFDNYVRDVLTAKNQDDVQNAAIKCEDTLAEDLPVIPVFSKNPLLATSSRIPVSTIVGSISDTVRSTVLNIVNNPGFAPPLRIGFTSKFDNLDPITSSNRADWTALHLLTEPLLTIDHQGRLGPALATQWKVSDDGTVITISIRQNAKFNNGQTITVNDLAATLNWLIRNVKSSSPLFLIMKEISRAYVLDQNSVRIILSRPDKLAVNQFTELFALPEGRLSNNPSPLDPVRNQLLVSSGPFVLREFTQRDGVYMQLNNPYFSKPAESLGGIQVFEGLRSEVRISSSPLLFDKQPVRNASYLVCVYDQNDLATQCVQGDNLGDGTYSAVLHVDSRFHVGPYKVESTVFGTLKNGTFMIFDKKTMMVSAFPLIPLLIFATLILAAVIGIKGRELIRPRRRREIRRRRGSRTSNRRIGKL
jgi:ABC-type transport system substrate-binding protein